MALPAEIEGIWDAWQTGNQETRRNLVCVLFDSVLIEDGEITGWTPRADRTAEVVSLMESLVGIRLEGFSQLATKRGAVFR